MRTLSRISRSSRRHSAPTEAVLTAAVLATLAASAVAQRQFDELRMRGLPPVTDSTRAVALGDVDGDGDLDMVLGQNRLFLNDGSGTYFDATARLPAASGNAAVALGDVDGDSDVDIVFGDQRLVLNDGTGTFSDATAQLPPASGNTSAVALGDVDGDGDLDMVSANGGQNRLLLNDGTGTFSDATVQLPPDNDPSRAVVLGDIDGDSDPDMLFANVSGAVTQSRLYLNDGSGTYTDATALRLPAHNDGALAMALGDVDGDGDLDMVAANSASPFGSQTRLYFNNGSGTFSDSRALTPGNEVNTRAVVLGDVDGDGDLDMILGNVAGQQNRLLLNDGSGNYSDTTASLPADLASTNAVALGDVDGDGDLDMVSGNSGNRLRLSQDRLFLNDGGGRFLDATAAPLPTALDFTLSVALGDVDGDGDLDMVAGNSGRQNRLYVNDGSNNYTDVTAQALPSDSDSTRAMALGDVDGDGDLDLVYANDDYQGQNRLLLNDGRGTFTDATALLPTGSRDSWAVALGDVDGDSDLDMVLGHRRAREHNRLYLNDGRGNYTDATAQALPFDSDSTRAVALGDVDGDGDLDLVYANDDFQSQNRLLLNDGSGTFSDVTAARMPVDDDRTLCVALGDVDGDGDLDTVFGNGSYQGPEQNRLYLNDGTGTFSDATAQLPGDNDISNAVALGDLDGDGDLDMVFGNDDYFPSGQQNRLYLNDGGGFYTDATAARLPAGDDVTHSLVLGDLDGDGDLDMAFGNRGQNGLLLNLLRHLDTPFLAIPGREYRLDAYARHGPARAGDIALAFISTASASVQTPPLGTIGIDPSRSAALPPLFVPQPTGMSSVSFTVPNQPRLIGVSVYAQALLLPFGGPWRLTNVAVDQIAR